MAPFIEEPSTGKEDWYKTVRDKFIKTEPKLWPIVKPESLQTVKDWWIEQQRTNLLSEAIKMPEGPEKDFAMFNAIVPMEAGAVRFIKRGGKITEYAGSINLDKLKVPEETKEIAREAGFKTSTRTWKETQELGERIYKDWDKMHKLIRKREGFTVAENAALRQANVDAMGALQDILRKDISNPEFDKLFKSYARFIGKTTSNAASESGRALNYYKKEMRIAKNPTECRDYVAEFWKKQQKLS